MRFALDNGQRIEAQAGRAGICPGCGEALVPKCGEIRAKHWAHVSQRDCDPWHEPEGQWHRDWKANFPDAWQEIVHHASNGERHIADIKTGRGCVIELQHSPLRPDERRARDSFYPYLLWVVDGTRRKTDISKLFKAWSEGSALVSGQPNLRRVRAQDSPLICEWSGCHAPVFFDVGDGTLVWMIRCRAEDFAYLLPVPRTQFIRIHLNDSPQELALEMQWKELPLQLALLDDELARIQQSSIAIFPRGVQRRIGRRNGIRRRF